MATKCAICEECKYSIIAVFNVDTGKMTFLTFKEHTCEYIHEADEPICYKAKVLARALELRVLAKQKRYPTAGEIRERCDKYVCKQITDNMCQDVRRHLQEAVYGNEAEELSKLGKYIKYLRGQGHNVELIHACKEELIDMSVQFQKGRHERAQKLAEGDEKTEWADLEADVRKAFEEHL